MSANLQISMKADFLGLPIDAAYKKSGTTQIFVLYGKAEERKAFTLNELIQQLGSTLTLGTINADTFKGLLPSELGDDVLFYLEYVYCVKGADTATEYALKISMDPGGITDGFIVKVSAITFMLWTTSKPAILDEMGIAQNQALLDYAG